MKLFLFILSFTLCSSQFFDYPEEPEKPKTPAKPKAVKEVKIVEVNQDSLIHKMHLFLVKNQSSYRGFELLMMHPSYPILINGILKKLDILLPVIHNKRGIDHKLLKEFGIDLENTVFIGYENLRVEVRDRIIKGLIDSLRTDQKFSQQHPDQ